MDKLDLAYIAGFFDGDGCVVIAKNKRQYMLRATIAQKAKISLFMILEKIYGGKSYSKNNHFAWTITSNRAVTFLQDILPYLRLKQWEVKIGLELQARIVSYKYQATYQKLSDFELAEREKLFQKIREVRQQRKEGIIGEIGTEELLMTLQEVVEI